jgi:hypothetical protein
VFLLILERDRDRRVGILTKMLKDDQQEKFILKFIQDSTTINGQNRLRFIYLNTVDLKF